MAATEDSGVALELQHVIGFAGDIWTGLQTIAPSRESRIPTMAFPAGSCVVLEAADGKGEQTMLRGHSAPVACLAASPIPGVLASGGSELQPDVVVWDTRRSGASSSSAASSSTGEVLYRFEEHDHALACLAFSDDGRVLATVGGHADGTVLFWDLATGCVIAKSRVSPSPASSIVAAGFVKDIKRRDTGLYQFVLSGRGGVSVYALNPLTGHVDVGKLPMPTDSGARDFTALCLTDDRSLLACGTASGEVLLVSVRHRQVIGRFPTSSGGVMSLCYVGASHGGAGGSGVLLAGCGDGTVVAVDVAVAVEICHSQHSGSVQSSGGVCRELARCEAPGGVSSIVPVAEDKPSAGFGDILFGCCNSVVCRVALDDVIRAGRDTGPRTATKPPALGPRDVILEAHEKRSAAAGEGVGKGGASAVAGKELDPSVGLSGKPAASVVAVAFAPGISDAFVTAGDDNTVRVWDGTTYEAEAVISSRGAGHPLSLACSPDLIVSGWEDGIVRSHSAEDGAFLWEIPNAHKGGVSATKVAANQRFAVTGGVRGELRLWDVRSRALVGDMREHAGTVTGIELYGDGKHAVTCSSDKSIVCWDLEKERMVSNHTQRMGGVHALALSRDESLVLTVGQERRVTFWDLRDPEPVSMIPAAHGERGEATCIAGASEHDWVVTGGTDSTVRLWDLASARCIAVGQGHSQAVLGVHFSPDDRQVVSVGEDGCVIVWDVFDLLAGGGDEGRGGGAGSRSAGPASRGGAGAASSGSGR